MRLLEWVLATIGAASTIAVALLSVPAARGDTGASAILGAVAIAGFLGFVATALDDKRGGRRWGAVVSLVAGMLGALVVLAGFSFGLFLVPAALAFLAAAVLAARRQGRSLVRQAGVYVAGALGTALVILLLNVFDWV
jgi:hypothetical protein